MPVEERTTTSDEMQRNAAMTVSRGLNFFAPETQTDLFGVPEVLRPSKYLPEQRLNRYLQEAVKLAEFKRLDDGAVFAEIPRFAGVWASDQDLAACVAQLREVLFDWLVTKIEQDDRDIPVVAGITLNVI